MNSRHPDPAQPVASREAATIMVVSDASLADGPAQADTRRPNRAAPQGSGLWGVMVFADEITLYGVEGAAEDIDLFVKALTAAPQAVTATTLFRRPAERRLFKKPGLAAPWVRPGEAVWLDAAIRRDPPDGERLLMFLRWIASRQAEADSGFQGAIAALAESWSPFDAEPGVDPEANPPSALFSPSSS